MGEGVTMTETSLGTLRQEADPGQRRPLVICVDDEPQILAALSRVLRGEPYEFKTTANPEEALDWVRTQEVSVLVADYRMPQMSGTTLLQLAKASSPRTARLMLTGYPGETLIIAAGEAGLMHLVGKPWNDDALKIKIRGLLFGEKEEADASQDLGGEGG
jgi:response regulator RpfG family c-di-GMP phosphodiesterase